MKRTKRALSFLLAVIMAMGLLPGEVRAIDGAYFGKNRSSYWEYDSTTKALKIQGKGELIVYEGDRSWNKYNDEVENIIIQEGITSVTEAGLMGYSTDEYDYYLKSTSLKQISLPASIRDISNLNDREFDSLESIVIAENHNLELIDLDLYSGNFGGSSLKHINIPKSPNSDYYSMNDVVFKEAVPSPILIRYPKNKSGTTYTIPNDIREIADGAFALNEHLEKIAFPRGLERIGEDAFHRCFSLTEVELPASLIEIGRNAFAECPKLQKVSIPNKVKEIRHGTFYECGQLRQLTLNEGLETANLGAFVGTDATITFPLSVKNVSFSVPYTDGIMATHDTFVFKGDIPNGFLLNDMVGKPFEKITFRYPATGAGWKAVDDQCAELVANGKLRKDKIVFERYGYVVTFDPNGGSVSTTEKATLTNRIDSVPVPTRAGYTFEGWFDANGKQFTASTDITNDLTVTARWKAQSTPPTPKTYTVTFNANGGAVSVASHATGTDGKLASLPTPTRANYTFDGWFDANGNRVTLDTVYTGDTTLTARWTENTGGGTGTGGGGSIGGGGSSSGSVSSRNGVSVPSSIPNGKVTSDAKNAKAGDTVTLTVTADEGFELKSLSVTDKKGNKIDLKDNGDGTYTFTMPNSKVTVEPEFVKKQDTPVTPPAPVEPERTYDDVKPDAWYNDAVEYVTENGLMNGTGEAIFEPSSTLSRAMVVTVLYRMEGEPAPGGNNDFTDVSESGWYIEAVIWASANGIIDGYGDGRFGPNDSVTREQFSLMLMRYSRFKKYNTSAENDISDYTDADSISTWAKEAMAWANAEGLITGRTATTLAPKGTATRAEAAAILMRFCENVK